MACVLARTVTHALVGLDPRRVEVEARLERASPSFTIVGLADRACQEAKERVRSGIRAAELEFPVRRITVNLAPAALRKEGAGFDLPIALAVLAASQQLPPDSLDGIAAFGELALDGRVRAVPGALVAAEGARRSRATKLVCASESAPEVALAGVEPVPVFHLADAVAYLRGEYDPPPPDVPRQALGRGAPDLADVRGQERGRRAIEIAAAGRHNVLLAGPPGTGKTMLARRLPGVLPLLDDENALEVTRIHSVAGMLEPGGGLIRVPPFRAPHHSSSMPAVIGGGGGGPRPGEASLAHLGVLFLDEFPEFARPVLESLRQPLEDGVVSVVRVAGRATFPARFQLVGDHESLPVRRARRPGDAVQLRAAAHPSLPREGVARAARPLRPVADRAPATRGGTRRSARRALGRRTGTRGRCARPAGCRCARAVGCGGRVVDACRRTPAALGARTRARRAGRRDDRGPRRSGARRAGAPRRGVVLPAAAGVDRVSELATAVFAAERGEHLVEAPRSRRFDAFRRSFDEAAYRRDLASRGLSVDRARRSPLPGPVAHDPRSTCRVVRPRRAAAARCATL